MHTRISLPQSFLAAALLLGSLAVSAQSKAISFDFFSEDSGRTNLTHDETRTARPKIIKRGRRYYQVFINKRTARELFRVFVGTDEAMWWVYGLVQEADINGDGVPDFCWHGGDDTSDLNLLVLSSPSGYRKVDVYETLKREWKRRFPTERMDSLENEQAETSEIKLIHSYGKVTMQALVTSKFMDPKTDDVKTYIHRLRVPESRFVYMK